MKYFIVILIIIIVFQRFHLFLVKRELKNITKDIDEVKNSDSNNLIHNNYGTSELNGLINKINNLLSEIKETKIIYSNKNKNLTKMMTNISHDLRTPLTSAIGYIDLILNSDISNEEKMQSLMIIERKLNKLEELVSSFFEFSKIVSGSVSTKLDKVNVISILESSIASFYEDFISEKRKINYTSTNNKIIISANQKMLIRIFDNLIANALKHGKSDLKITIKAAKNISIIFENEMKDKDIDIKRIFEEFYTADISRTKGNTGLGLAIVKEFTENLDGKVYAEKVKNKLKIVVEFIR